MVAAALPPPPPLPHPQLNIKIGTASHTSHMQVAAQVAHTRRHCLVLSIYFVGDYHHIFWHQM